MAEHPPWALGFQTYTVEGRIAVPTTFRRDAEDGAEQAEEFTGRPMIVFRYRKYLRWGWAWAPNEESTDG